ncbi:MAG: hypothetical protein NC299_07165 [Lachnospiraceae bacterium]|nr:hypothetical protein [Ruminococcus sp.]MCM1275134.1 hypothetical protein [Lachnospiraceae bacterium]
MNKRNGINGAGLGVGYVSVMIIFAVICLTIFAVLSFSAASSSGGFNERSGEFLKEYYAADSAAKLKLALLDGLAKDAAETGFFEDEFEYLLDEAKSSGTADFGAELFGGITLKRIGGGFAAVWTEKINDRQELAAEVSFTSGGYEITRWQSRTISADASDEHLGVWDGSF